MKDFSWALGQLKNNTCVTRKEWEQPSRFLSKEGGVVTMLDEDGRVVKWEAPEKDMLAEDWLVVT